MPTADELLGASVARDLAKCLGGDLPATSAAADEFDGLSLSARTRKVRDALLADLPTSYAHFEQRLRDASDDPAFTGWMIWPVTEALAVRATTGGTAEFDAGLARLAELTSRLTGEFALRTFLDVDLDRTLAVALEWTGDPDPHVRRLASEGTRPYLPWARRVAALTRRPDATAGILRALYRDESEYVRRSVANHLNDLARTDPDLVVASARAWMAEPDANTPKLVRHGLRTLVKKGHTDALDVLGFSAPDGITVSDLRVSPADVLMGADISFGFELANTSGSTQTVAVDYVVHHVRANGGRTPKVFKLTQRTLAPGSRETLTRAHSFRPITTRRYYPGEHLIEIQVNGTVLADAVFRLAESTDTMLA